MEVALAVVLGLVFGSFATVAAHRIPLRQGIVSGRSICPHCDRSIRAIENVPVLSWVFLRGRCRGCNETISVRYPLMELATAALFAGAALKFDVTLEAFVYAAFFWVLIVLTMIDLDHKLLPDRVVFPTFIAGWIGLTTAALIDGDAGRLAEAALGAAMFGGFLFVIAFAKPGGMGLGDVKLAFVLGTFLGYIDAPGVVLVGVFLSFLGGGVIGLVLMAIAGKGRKTAIPFGPFLALGTVAGIFWGQPLLDAYLGAL